MTLLTTIIFLAADFIIPLLPNPSDKDGWGLRIGRPTVAGTYLVGEDIHHIQFKITLVNFGKQARKHPLLSAALRQGELAARIIQPNGNELPSVGLRAFIGGRLLTAELRAGGFTSLDFRFADFGYTQLRTPPGRHRLDTSLMIDGKKIASPPIAFDVIEPSPDAILVSHTVPLEGRAAKHPADEQHRPFVQQVKVGKRTLLIYRRFAGSKWGGGIDGTFRLAELPGKVEMKVEGAYGANNPLTITYKDAKSPTGTTKLVINSIDGMPWTAEEERLRQERLRPGKP